MSGRASAAVLGLVACVGCGGRSATAASPAPSVPEDAARCYQLFVRSRPAAITGPRVRLDTARYSGTGALPNDGRRAMWRIDEAGSRREGAEHEHAFWGAGADTLRLSFTNGLSGLVWELGLPRVGADTLHGRVVRRYDVAPFELVHRPAFATRVPCTPAAP